MQLEGTKPTEKLFAYRTLGSLFSEGFPSHNTLVHLALQPAALPVAIYGFIKEYF